MSRRFEVAAEQVSVIPSLVFVEGRDRISFGESVRAKRLGFAQPERCFRAFKRDLAAKKSVLPVLKLEKSAL